MDLMTIRQNIDRIDSRIVELLNERTALALRTRASKDSSCDPEREFEVLRLRGEQARIFGPENERFIVGIFREIIRECRRRQKNIDTGEGPRPPREERAPLNIAVIGAGNMGSWLAAAFAGRHTVALYDSDPSKSAHLQRDIVLSGPPDLVRFAPDLLINAVSLRNTIRAFEAALPHLSRECILCDVASVKGEIPDFYRESGRRFVSLHPMFGPTFANIDRLEDENVVIISESDTEFAAFFRRFFEELGLGIHMTSFAEHDRMIAYALGLPFASTLVFASSLTSTPVPGTTFRKHLEIARGLLSEDDGLLAEILFNPHSMTQLEAVTGRLEFLKHIIKQKDDEEAKAFFDRLRTHVRNQEPP